MAETDAPPERALAAIETMRLRLNDDRALARWVDVYRQSGWRSPPLLPMRAVAEEREPR